MTRTTPNADRPTYAPDSRDLPWNVMGGALTNLDGTDVQTVLIEQGMDYDVRTVPLQTAEGLDDQGRLAPDAERLAVPKHRAIVRPAPGGLGEEVVGVVGTRYTPIQNRDAFAVANVLAAEFDSRIIGAADFRNGGSSLLVVDLRTPVTLTLPNGQQDRTDLDLMIRNAHDGQAALTFALIGMRLACTNAVQAALADARRTWKIAHTPNAAERQRLAQDAILASLSYRDAFQEAAQALVDQAMTDREFDKIVARLWPVAEGREETRAGQNALAIRDEVKALYHTSPTLEGARGTLYGGVNAITEWYDWARPVVGGATSRAEGSLDGPYVRRKARVWDTFLAALS